MECATHNAITPTLVEEAILNPGVLPAAMAGWRCYRIEYGFECSCPEGLIYLPPNVDPSLVEDILKKDYCNIKGANNANSK